MTYKFSGELWEFQGPTSWYFVSLPTDTHAELKMISREQGPGFGSIRVEATIGSSTWKTSIFPDSKSKTFLLPIKKSIREQESISAGDEVRVRVKLAEVV
ncbi:MAG: DUF1905 domain-containing protein [Patescibacteria group bacterium]